MDAELVLRVRLRMPEMKEFSRMFSISSGEGAVPEKAWPGSGVSGRKEAGTAPGFLGGVSILTEWFSDSFPLTKGEEERRKLRRQPQRPRRRTQKRQPGLTGRITIPAMPQRIMPEIRMESVKMSFW